MYEFDRDTALTPNGNGRYDGTLSPLWNVGLVPNGGYVLALAMAALGREFDGLAPLTVTAHYLGPSAPGPVRAHVDVLKRGRTYATATAALVQDDRETVRVLATYGRLDDSEPIFRDAQPPAPSLASCVPLKSTGPVPEIARRFDVRIAPDDAERMRAGRAERAELRGWLRFADDRPADPDCLGLIADAFPPPVFLITERGWVPTLELTVHVRARPSSSWLNCGFRTRLLGGGLLEEDGEIWDASGALVAMTRQLAGAPRVMRPD